VTPTHVGALARITVPAASINSNRNLVVFAERLREATSREAATMVRPTTVPLFTVADITAIKPSLVVRGRDPYRRAVFWCAVIFLVSFQLVSLVWRLRGVAGDRLLLAAAHVLATLGFLVMLSRPDPLRDTLLLVRFTEGVVLGLVVCLACSLLEIRKAFFLRLSYLSLALAIVLSVARLAAAAHVLAPLSTAATSAATLSVVDQMPTSLRRSRLAPSPQTGRAAADAAALTLSFRSYAPGAKRTADCVGVGTGALVS
jgi:hypothetical protein